jgi:thioredoxin-dependent peroxiredoxin
MMGMLRTLLVALVAGAAFTGVLAAQSSSSVTLKAGDQAPDFTLKASDGKTYSLADYRGKKMVIVAWFPKAFTQGCTLECKSLAANGDRLRKYDVAYFMASVDAIEDNTRFAESEKADFPLLSDGDKSVATRYGVLAARGLANRWTFYIDKSGRIAYVDRAVNPETSAEDIIGRLAQLKVAAVN